MGNLAYLGLAVALSTVGLTVLWLVRRRPRSIQASMDAFRREMTALAPPDAEADRLETHVDQVQPTRIRTRGTARPRGRPGRGRHVDSTPARVSRLPGPEGHDDHPPSETR
ncbi:MAG: hypothetical protein OEY23_09695 [Acidimicrobiia bacterium]|nr:hypothetical protein [Acidimicrobiia bacterium]